MSGIFVSYRRDDSSGYATLIYDTLASRFGRERVFMDVDTLEPGVDYGVSINSHVDECDVMVALIGRRWLGAAAADGQRRLDDPEDWVRTEVSSALARDVRVIPVLVDGAQMPLADELPQPLTTLSRREALSLTSGHVRQDLQRLSDAIDTELRAHDAASGRSSWWRRGRNRRLATAAAIAAALVAVAFVVHDRRSAPSTGDAGNPYAHGRSCGAGLYAGPNTSCAFALNVRRAYDRAPPPRTSVRAFSPVTHATYTMRCRRSASLATCEGAIRASVAFDD